MPDPATAAVAATVTIINGTFSLVQTFFRLGEVDEDLKICLKLLEIVARDLNYARRQLQNHKSSQSLQISPADLRHFESAIDDTDAATLSLGELVQAYRVQRDVDKRISPGYRFKWVFQGKERFARRQGVLNMTHNSLLAAIQKMNTVALAAPEFTAPPPYNAGAPAGNSKILRSPSQQRTLKGKSSIILRSSEEQPPQASAPGLYTPTSQDRQSGQAQSRRSLPTVPRLRRMPHTENGGSMGAIVEEK
jgi:hypothetical protein